SYELGGAPKTGQLNGKAHQRGHASAQGHGQWKPRTRGTQVDSAGKIVRRASTTRCASRNGGNWRTSALMRTSIVTEAMNSSPPTGSVILPRVRFTITTIAKCRGSIPSAAAVRARMGTRIITPGRGPRKI